MIKIKFLCSIAKDINDNKIIEQNLKNKNFVIDPESMNEDSWALSSSLNKIALSDGASESYNSKLWSQLLCKNFIEKPSDDFNLWVNNTICDYIALNDISKMSWSQISSYERGSFATFIGINYDHEANKLKILNIGDSVPLLFKKQTTRKFIKNKKARKGKKCTKPFFFIPLLKYLPLYEIPNFQSNPTLLSTNKSLNNFEYKDYIKEISLNKKDTYYLLIGTDAISDWLINIGKINKLPFERLSKILQLSENQLASYIYEIIMTNRSSKKMKMDDTTLIILEIN